MEDRALQNLLQKSNEAHPAHLFIKERERREENQELNKFSFWWWAAARWQGKFPRRGNVLLVASLKLNWTSVSVRSWRKMATLVLRLELQQPGQESLSWPPGHRKFLVRRDEGCGNWPRGSEKVWLPWGQHRTLCQKGGHKRPGCTAQVESLCYKLLGGPAVRKACVYAARRYAGGGDRRLRSPGVWETVRTDL